MKYAKSELGRVFLLKFDDGDVLIREIDRFARRERLKAAAMIFLGALKEGDIVTGPKRPTIPPEPNWNRFKDGWEVAGIGTIFTNKKGPQIHIHTAMGKGAKTLTGCVRKETKVFLVIEAVVLELKGPIAKKETDPKTGLNLLRIIRPVT